MCINGHGSAHCCSVVPCSSLGGPRVSGNVLGGSCSPHGGKPPISDSGSSVISNPQFVDHWSLSRSLGPCFAHGFIIIGCNRTRAIRLRPTKDTTHWRPWYRVLVCNRSSSLNHREPSSGWINYVDYSISRMVSSQESTTHTVKGKRRPCEARIPADRSVTLVTLMKKLITQHRTIFLYS